MTEPNNLANDKPTVPETRFYKWEEQPRIRVSKARQMLQNRIAHTTGKALQAYTKTLETLNAAWQKHGFDDLTTEKLKSILIAVAKDLDWHHENHAPDFRKPAQPDDPNLKTCPTCKQTKPKSQFTRLPSPKKAKQYGWREDTRIKTPHEQCNYCASPKRKSIAPKITTPTIAKLRQQISEKLQVARRMEESQYRDRKIELLEAARLRVEDYLRRGVRGPDEWHMMLTKPEKNELESLHRRVHWPRRVPAVF